MIDRSYFDEVKSLLFVIFEVVKVKIIVKLRLKDIVNSIKRFDIRREL